MGRRRLIVLVSLAASLAVAVVGFHVFVDPMRDFEGLLVMAFMSPLGSRSTVVDGYMFQVLPPHHEAFRALLTPYCSAVIPALALATIGLFVLSGTLLRRVVAVVVAVSLVLVCNVLRISGSLWMGYEYGGGALVLFHDWVGTFFALGYTMAGFFLMLYLLLPSATAQTARAARVSDVL